MKKIRNIIMVAIIAIIASPGALAQDLSGLAQEEGNDERFIVKTNPLAALGGPFWLAIVPITGEYKVLFEAQTMPRQSVTLGASYIGPSLLLNLDELTAEGEDVSGIKTAGFRVQGMYKFYLNRETESPEGLYLAPHFSYASASIKSKDVPDDRINMNKMNFNGIIGYQLISSGGFALDVYTGLGIKSRRWSFEGSSEEIFDINIENKASASVAFGLSFGYAF